MARILTILFLLLFPLSSWADVLPGIDMLARRNFDILQGKRVGLITNNTGRSADGRSTIDLINKAPGVKLVTLFSPEHGIRGDSDVKLSSSTDSRTGLPIYSLYGKSCRISQGMLSGLDIIVFDIQDIGARFYTYIGTLYYSLQAARHSNIPIVVLDRPNPVGGTVVEGVVPQAAEVARRLATDKTGCRSLTVIHPIPARHGLTIGELAILFNREASIGADLHVVRMEGWNRDMLWKDTGLKWVNPSPNMKDPVAALLYPAFGPLEATNLSVARGTDRPFHYYGAPWLDSASVLKKLPELPGISFGSTCFVPTAPGHPYQGKRCQGIEVKITDIAQARLPVAALHLAKAIYTVHPDRYKAGSGFSGMTGDRQAWRLLTVEGASPEKIVEKWDNDIKSFLTRRKLCILY